jgi:hypothetical protein
MVGGAPCGPMLATIPTPPPGWSVYVYTRQGDTFTVASSSGAQTVRARRDPDRDHRARDARRDGSPRRDGGQHPPRAGAPDPARARQPPAHQDAQDPDRPDADGGGRGRHHLPEAGRGGGLRGRAGGRRRAADLQHPGRGQDRAADGAGAPGAAARGGVRQRGGGPRALRGGAPGTGGSRVPRRVRHRLRRTGVQTPTRPSSWRGRHELPAWFKGS